MSTDVHRNAFRSNADWIATTRSSRRVSLVGINVIAAALLAAVMLPLALSECTMLDRVNAVFEQLHH